MSEEYRLKSVFLQFHGTCWETVFYPVPTPQSIGEMKKTFGEDGMVRGNIVSFPAESLAEPRSKTNLVHFRHHITHLVEG